MEEDVQEEDGEAKPKKGGRRRGRGRGRGRRAQYRNKSVEVVGGEEGNVEQRFRFNLRRKYKIQEVIKRGQIMLVQVNKEERGNKGAAVGTYLSLPGRYCVLMPNSPRAGGVSRKIANSKDRSRMRDIVKSLEIPKDKSVIVRTAGVARTKSEIKRDLDYLMRLWNNIRDLTLQSNAPALVYEEADLIKRSVRDLYARDVEEIYVSGENGYKTAKDFMKMMIPSHVKKVKRYEDEQLPLFHRYQIESQIDEIGQTEVRLKSGGYLVINPTEALVSIDVNSGKATKGRHIEETALKTNLEAAEEVARQLKLRDLGGLVVIDFIDMEDRRNNGKVERRMRDALSTDRARVQVGRISSFGLMELSRQRLSPSLTEAQFERCTHCMGTGVVRTSDAMSILVLRSIEEEGLRARAAQIIVQVSTNVALYILNHKRRKLGEIEARYNFEVLFRMDDSLPASEFRLEVSRPVQTDQGDDEDESTTAKAKQEQSDEDKTRKGRGRRGGRNRNRGRQKQSDDSQVDAQSEVSQEFSDSKVAEVVSEGKVEASNDDVKAEPSEDKPKRKRRTAKKSPEKQEEALSANDERDAKESKSTKAKADEGAEKAKPKKAARKPKKEVASVKKEDDTPSAASEHEVVNQKPEKKKRGWWNLPG